MANEQMIRVWNEVNAPRWLQLRRLMAEPLVKFGDAALAALAPAQGENALDVGCGFGETTVALARLCGDALGVDVCEPFLEIARAEAEAGARFLLADAQTRRFEEKFSLLYSRFGVMFFDDPAAAFANLRAALLPGARMSIVVWGRWQENEWVTAPMRVVRKFVAAPDPAAGPGPFALSDAGALSALLAGAGFVEVSVTPIELPFEADAEQLTFTGPAAAALREANAGEDVRARIAAELADALGGRKPRALALLVTAHLRP